MNARKKLLAGIALVVVALALVPVSQAGLGIPQGPAAIIAI